MKKLIVIMAGLALAGVCYGQTVSVVAETGEFIGVPTAARIDAIEAGTKLPLIASGKIIVGNAGGTGAVQTVTGDISLSNAGVAAIASGVIVNADIATNAAIAASKLADADLGDVSIAAGVVSIDAGVIVNADVNASAAIAGSKLDLTSGTGAATIGGAFAAQRGVTFADTNNVAREFRVSNDYRHVITPNALGAQTNTAEIAVVSSFNTISAAGAVTNTVASPYAAGQVVTIINIGAETITFETGGNIKGAEIALTADDAMQLYSADGTNWWPIATILTP